MKEKLNDEHVADHLKRVKEEVGFRCKYLHVDDIRNVRMMSISELCKLRKRE